MYIYYLVFDYYLTGDVLAVFSTVYVFYQLILVDSYFMSGLISMGFKAIVFFSCDCTGFSLFILVSMMTQNLVLPSSGNQLSPSILLNSGLSSYSYAVNKRLFILNSLLSTKSNNFFAKSLFSGITMIPYPSFFKYLLIISITICGEYPRFRTSGNNTQSNLLVNLKRSFYQIFMQLTFRKPFFSQLFAMFPTTSSLVSHITTFLQSAHCFRAIPAMPTPARNTITSLVLNRLLSSIANLAKTMSISQSRSPSSSCGKRAMSEMSSFILKAQWRMISLFLKRRVTLLPSALVLCLLLSLPIYWNNLICVLQK